MAKSDKGKVPKTVAGLKIPKALRRSGLLDGLVSSPAGRQLLADALVAAAAAAAASLVKASAADLPEGGKCPAKGGLGEAAKAAAGAIAGVLAQAPDGPGPKAAEANGAAPDAASTRSGKRIPDDGASKAGRRKAASRRPQEEPRAGDTGS